MRARVRDAIALVTVTSLLLFGVPLAVVLDRLIASQALAGLQRDATRAVAAVPDNVLQARVAVGAPRSHGDTLIGVYDAQGRLVAGRGPARSALAARVADGREHDSHDGGDLAVLVPVLSDAGVAGGVRAGVRLSLLHRREHRAWALLCALALGILAVAGLLARRAARRISEPFEGITTAARALGDGRYDVQLPRWGIPEADGAAAALQDSARQVDLLLAHERQFMSDASHQLRTPLTAALLALGRRPPDASAAQDSLHHLQATISDLLSLRAAVGAGSCQAREVAEEAVQRWSTVDRPVSLRADEAEPAALSAPALRQALDVLIVNALHHGAGAVTVTVEPVGDAVVVEVCDEGDGFDPDASAGTGLRLAARIAERAGGSLLVRRRSPRARVALLLPAVSPPRTGSRSP